MIGKKGWILFCKKSTRKGWSGVASLWSFPQHNSHFSSLQVKISESLDWFKGSGWINVEEPIKLSA